MPIRGYEVEINDIVTDIGLPPLVDGKRQYDITGLTPETSKQVRVRAYRSRKGNWTEEITATTLPPFVPTQLTQIHQWFDMEELGLANDAAIETLTDLSGNDYHVTQAT